MQLAQLLDEKQKATTQILVVSVDSGAQSQSLIERLAAQGIDVDDIHFLEDREHRVIDRYGLFNPQVHLGVAHPATYVIDDSGIVRWAFAKESYTQRAPNAQIIEALSGL